MPKVQVDVDVSNQQEFKDLSAQVISLQQSLEKLKTTAKGQPFQPMQQEAGQASDAIAQINKQLDVTSAKLQDVQEQHRGVARVAQATWKTFDTISTITSIPAIVGGAYKYGRRGWNYAAEALTPEALPETVATASRGFGVAAGVGIPLGVAAGVLYGTNRVADYAQNQILQARSLGMSVAQYNDLNAIAAGTRNRALGGLDMLYQGTDTNDLAWRSMGMRSGLSVAKGDDTADVIAQLATKIRQMPSYDQRVKTIQELYPGGDPKQILDALDANLGRFAKRLDEVNRSIDDSAMNRLTRFKDWINDITNLPGNVPFEVQVLGQRIKAGAINAVFADDTTGRDVFGMRTAQRTADGLFVLPSASNTNPRAKEIRALLEQANQAVTGPKDARDVQNAKDAMAALGLGESMSYGNGQTLVLTPDSVHKAQKYANDYLDTWLTKGAGVSGVLQKHMNQLAQLDAEMARLGELGMSAGTPRTVDILRRDALQQQIYKETNIYTSAQAVKGLRETLNNLQRVQPEEELSLTDQVQVAQLQRAMQGFARPTNPDLLDWQDRYRDRARGAQLYDQFRNRSDGSLPDVLQQFMDSRGGRLGRIAGMRRDLAKIYSPGGDTSADANYRNVINLLTGDVYRQDAQMRDQQRAAFGMQMTQVMAEPGQERQTAKALYDQQTAAADLYFSRSLKGHDEEVQLIQAKTAAQEKYLLTLLNLSQIEKQRARAFPSQIAGVMQGFNMQMIGLTAEPGQERQTFGANYQQQVQFAREQMRRNIAMGMPPDEAAQQFQIAGDTANQQWQLSNLGFSRQRREEARQYDIQDISSTTQFDIGHLQLWAMPGQERQLQGLINARERRSLQEQIDRAGGTYSPRQTQAMRAQQGMREASAADQLDRQDYLRQRDLELEKVQTELQLTSQIVALRNDGEFITAKKTHELRLEVLQKELDLTGDIYAYGKQERAENLSYQQQLNQINAQRKANVEGQAGTLFDDIWGSSLGRRGGPNRPLAGVGAYLGQLGTSTARTIFTQTAGELWKTITSVANTSGGAIPGQLKDDGEGGKQLTVLGRILKGTFLGVDQSKLVQNAATTANTASNQANTIATDRLTNAILAMLSRSGGVGGSGGGGGGGFSLGPVGLYSPANWGSSTAGVSPMGYDYGYSPASWGSPLAGVPTMSMGPMDASSYDFDPTAPYDPEGAHYSPMSGYSQMSPQQASGGVVPLGVDYGYSPVRQLGQSPGFESLQRARAMAGPSRGATIAKGVGKGAGAVAAAYGTYAGIKKGGAAGGLQAASAALGGVALFAGPAAAPFLAAASIIAGTVSMFLPDSYAKRMREEDDWIRNSQLKLPDPVQLTVNVNGQSVDYNFKGQIRSYGTTSGLGTPGTAKTVTSSGGNSTPQLPTMLDPVQTANLASRVTVVQNFHLLDTQSLMSRRSEIAEVTRAVLDDFHPLRHTIQQLGR